GHYDSAGCRAADLLGTASRVQAFEAADGGDGYSEHEALDQAGNDVAQKQGIERSDDVTPKSKVGLRNAKERAAEDAHEVGPDREARKHQDHGDEFRSDEETDGIDGHGFQGINFLRDFHGAEFGGKGRPGTPDDNDRGDEGTKFTGHGKSD